MSDIIKLLWTDWRGKEQVREVKQTIDIRNFKDTMGYAWLVMAANPHLSASDIQEYLRHQGSNHERGLSWIKRRRKLFVPVGTLFASSPKNLDGKDERAFQIMREFSTVSLRMLVRILKDNGIKRGKDWVRLNRTR